MKEPVTPPVGVSSTGPPPAGGPYEDLTGKALGDFQILRRLGQGGMGQVYLAEQRSLKRKVALKIMRAELAANPVSLQRFKQEAEAVARATHANIVQVYAIGEADGVHYMALEYVEGRTLREFVEKKGPPEVLVALSIMRQVAAALQRAAELGVIHRDIKPENILLTRKGEAKVADFGLSQCFLDDQPARRLTRYGVTVGTPLYMSPEQAEGRPVDPRTDIYSFGVTCYYMLAGQPPYLGDDPVEVALKHVEGKARPLAEICPQLPPELCAIVHKMMACRPEDRYQTAREIVRDVARLRDVLVGVVTPQVIPVTPARPRGRWALAGVLTVALGAGALAGWLNRPPPEKQSALSPEPAGPGNREPLLTSRMAHRQHLETEFRGYADPGQDPSRVSWGLKCAADLGIIYLEDWDLEKADQLFRELDQPNRPAAYQKLGQLGQAIVLAFRSRPPAALEAVVGCAAGRAAAPDLPRESNRLFLQLVPLNWKRTTTRPAGPEVMWFNQLVWTNRQWRRMIARALNHNFDNDPRGFPPKLHFLRRPPESFAKK